MVQIGTVFLLLCYINVASLILAKLENRPCVSRLNDRGTFSAVSDCPHASSLKNVVACRWVYNTEIPLLHKIGGLKNEGFPRVHEKQEKSY